MSAHSKYTAAAAAAAHTERKNLNMSVRGHCGQLDLSEVISFNFSEMFDALYSQKAGSSVRNGGHFVCAVYA